MDQQALSSTLWSCDRIGCTAKATSYDPSEAPPGWLSIVGGYQDSQGGGPIRLDLCTKHTTAFYKSYSLQEDY